MCGISVVLCKKRKNRAVHILLKSLEQLQNRGYDSFGMSCISQLKIHNSLSDSSSSSGSSSDISNLSEITNNDDVSIHDINDFVIENTIEKCGATMEKDVYYKLSIDKMACLTSDDTFEVFKIRNNDKKSNVAVGHTRWATHGAISHDNTHPHQSYTEVFNLVHNGIIENYKEIKNRLEVSGCHFYSDTDSEVIANLIDFHYTNCKLDRMNDSTRHNIISHAILLAIQELEGTYGLAIQCIYDPDSVYLIRNGSPLLIGENDSYIMATSEASGFANQVSQYYSLETNDLVRISLQDGIITDTNYEYISNKSSELILSPAPYKHWTEREVMEQKDSLMRSTNNGARIHNNVVKLGGVEYLQPYIKEIDNIILLGCGTSLNACHIATYYLKQMRCVNNIYCVDAAEFSLQDMPMKNKSLIIMCSQSGETMDLHRILHMIKDTNCITMGIINVVDSLIAREVDCGIYMNAGREVAVGSTKSFTSTVLLLKMFSMWYYQQCQDAAFKIPKICQNIRNVIEQVGTINNTIRDCIQNVHIEMLNHENVFILGKGKMEYIAKEAALKMKELCYIHAEGYSGSALKHGPFALLKKGFPVILIIDKEHESKMMNAYKEIESRGANILVVSEIKDLQVKKDNLLIVPENSDLQEILFIVVLQHICYHLSLLRDINPDKPRNLAKVVTVE